MRWEPVSKAARGIFTLKALASLTHRYYAGCGIVRYTPCIIVLLQSHQQCRDNLSRRDFDLIRPNEWYRECNVFCARNFGLPSHCIATREKERESARCASRSYITRARQRRGLNVGSRSSTCVFYCCNKIYSIRLSDSGHRGSCTFH